MNQKDTSLEKLIETVNILIKKTDNIYNESKDEVKGLKEKFVRIMDFYKKFPFGFGNKISYLKENLKTLSNNFITISTYKVEAHKKADYAYKEYDKSKMINKLKEDATELVEMIINVVYDCVKLIDDIWKAMLKAKQVIDEVKIVICKCLEAIIPYEKIGKFIFTAALLAGVGLCVVTGGIFVGSFVSGALTAAEISGAAATTISLIAGITTSVSMGAYFDKLLSEY